MKSFSISQLSSLFAFVNEKLKNILCYMSTQFYLFEDKVIGNKISKNCKLFKFFVESPIFSHFPFSFLSCTAPNLSSMYIQFTAFFHRYTTCMIGPLLVFGVRNCNCCKEPSSKGSKQCVSVM